MRMHASNDHQSVLLSWSMLNPLAVTEMLYDIIFRQAGSGQNCITAAHHTAAST